MYGSDSRPSLVERALMLLATLATLSGCRPIGHVHAPHGWADDGPKKTTSDPEVWVPRDHAAGLPMDLDSVKVFVPRSALGRGDDASHHERRAR
jgi:hypothetical protein